MKSSQYINSVNLNAGTAFPYLVLDVHEQKSAPRNPGFQVLHWHEDLQFVYVFEGNAELQTLEESVRLKAGEGVFLNKNVVHQILQQNVPLPPQKQENVVNTRMRCFLQYVEAHYPEEITLEQLAQSAHVSKSECLRCFRVSLQTTPYQYLMEHRLSCAARLLKETDRSIGDIAEQVGFHQVSHFGKCFKEKTGCTPSEYRKIKQGAPTRTHPADKQKAVRENRIPFEISGDIPNAETQEAIREVKQMKADPTIVRA